MTINLRVPTAEYDRVYALARIERVTIPEWIRKVIAEGHEQNRQK